MPHFEDGFLTNRSYTQHMLLTVGLALLYLAITGLMIYAYFARMPSVEPSKKALVMIGGILLATVVFGPITVWFIFKLRNTPTHVDISRERVVLRYQWGEASFSMEELLCFVGSEDRPLFASRIHGALLKDGSELEMFILDDEFVEDLFALSRKKKVPLEQNWKVARERFGQTQT